MRKVDRVVVRDDDWKLMLRDALAKAFPGVRRLH
jgi:hypothetical protein